MRKFVAALALLFPFTVFAAPTSVTFFGQITSYEQLVGGVWVPVNLTDPSMEWTIRPLNEAIAERACTPGRDFCDASMMDLFYQVIDTSLRFGNVNHQPDLDIDCAAAVCSAYDPFEITRSGDAHTAFFGDQRDASHLGGPTIGSRIFVNLSGTGWIPDGTLGVASIYGFDGAVDGTGTFSHSIALNDIWQDGSYRGTFVITSAYVPTPGTFALLAMGGLVFGLRRHARSKVI